MEGNQSKFAPAERASEEDLRRQLGYFSKNQITRPLLDAIPTILTILNRQRQVVYANKALLGFLDVGEETMVLGQRPGEALGCLHARESEGGCGTSEPCSTCGTVLAILAGLAGKSEVRECRMVRETVGGRESLDLLVWATPFEFRQEWFTVFAVSDISHEKRRQALERIFFHDILNIAGGVRGFAEVLRNYDPHNRQEIYDLLFGAAEQIIEEIQSQRTLVAAENRDLRVVNEEFRTRGFLERLVEIYRRHETAGNRHLVLSPEVPDISLVSDRTLLARVIGNMIKNALEASSPRETVTISCVVTGETVEFRVHNRAVIPREIQLQIFNRSFSTKGPGRGLGTYSMKLLSEFLGGSVIFESGPGEGTVFRGIFPRKPG